MAALVAGELVGRYSRDLDSAYLRVKAPPDARHDVWGKQRLFHSAALARLSQFLTKGPFDAMPLLS